MNYDAAIQVRRGAIDQLKARVDELNAKIDEAKAMVPCHLYDILNQKLAPFRELIGKATGAISRIQKEIEALICMKNFPPGVQRRDCIRGEVTKKSANRGASGSRGGDGANGKNASKLSRMERALACSTVGAHGARGAGGRSKATSGAGGARGTRPSGSPLPAAAPTTTADAGAWSAR